jgi:hypothetical protein
MFGFYNNFLLLNATMELSWNSIGDVGNVNRDLTLARDAADTLAQRRGTNAQTFRLYNTFTDASNYERGVMRWSGNLLQIGTEKLGTGTARQLEFQTDGVSRIFLGASGGRLGFLSQETSTPTQFTGIHRYSNNMGISCQTGFRVFTDLVTPAIAFEVNTTTNLCFIKPSLLQLGGQTNAFPALKSSSTTLQARLADDSGFASVQGKITTEAPYTATPIVPTGYVTIYDSTGTAYKVACSL